MPLLSFAGVQEIPANGTGWRDSAEDRPPYDALERLVRRMEGKAVNEIPNDVKRKARKHAIYMPIPDEKVDAVAHHVALIIMDERERYLAFEDRYSAMKGLLIHARNQLDYLNHNKGREQSTDDLLAIIKKAVG